MSYPQPSSVLPVKNGQDFFRLTTPIVSSGDIYESEVSANAIVLGPNSDIARVQVTYFDPAQSVGLSTAVVSPDRSLTGLIPAVNTENYISGFSQANPRKGRVLFSLDDYYNPDYRPTLFDAVNDSIQFETPNLDLIAYFKGLPSVIPQRSDRTFTYQYLKAPPGGGGNSAWLVVPGYGRKSGYFTLNNLDGITTVTYFIIGVKLQPTGLGSPAGGWQSVLDTAALLTTGAAQYSYKASTDGLWDYFVIELRDYIGAAMPMTITLSDDAE